MLKEAGAFVCKLKGIEVMGRDISVVSTNEASLNSTIRSIISSENKVDTGSAAVRFDLRPKKVFLFDKETEERIYFEIGELQDEKEMV